MFEKCTRMSHGELTDLSCLEPRMRSHPVFNCSEGLEANASRPPTTQTVPKRVSDVIRTPTGNSGAPNPQTSAVGCAGYAMPRAISAVTDCTRFFVCRSISDISLTME
jgi:hypothetical protein